VQAILGRGIDNHLLGLRQIAERSSMKTPQLFLDGSYQTSNHFTLSTSQVNPPSSSFMFCASKVSEKDSNWLGDKVHVLRGD